MIRFDWDDANVKHLKAHRVTPEEFEQVIANEPIDLEFEVLGGAERYKSLGVTDDGRLLVVVWTVRGDGVRAITAYRAGQSLVKLWQELR